MALKRGVKFKTINKSFKDLEDLPEFSQSAKSTKTTKQSPGFSKFTKRTKVTPESEETEKAKEKDPFEDDLENLKNSYCLTMSQSICERFDDEEIPNKGEGKSDFVFESFTEVSVIQVINKLNFYKKRGNAALIFTPWIRCVF